MIIERASQIVRPGIPLAVAPVLIDPLTESVTLRIPRARLVGNGQVSLVITLDGEEYRCTGSVTGGLRLDLSGQPIDEYVLSYTPTWGFFGREDRTRRLGELGRRMTAHVEFYSQAGLMLPELLCEGTALAAPDESRHHSVAYDNASQGTEAAGDGVVSFSHTSTGSDRAIFAGSGVSATGLRTTNTITCGATSLSGGFPGWNATFDIYGNAGFLAAGQPSGASTVTATLNDTVTPIVQLLSVVTMTGVDQTTPTRGRVAGLSSGTTTPSTFTANGAVTDDLVVDHHVLFTNGTPAPGANQTTRCNPVSTLYGRISTQAGADGGVMSYDITGSSFLSWGVLALAFQPVASEPYELEAGRHFISGFNAVP